MVKSAVNLPSAPKYNSVTAAIRIFIVGKFIENFLKTFRRFLIYILLLNLGTIDSDIYISLRVFRNILSGHRPETKYFQSDLTYLDKKLRNSIH